LKTNEPVYNIGVKEGWLPEFYANGILVHNCAVSGIPLIELLGIQPMGLNATAAGEIQVFDDTIHSMQELVFRDPLTSVINFVQLSEFGEVDPEITFDFCPLRSLDDAELATVQKTKAETDATYVDLGAIDAGEVRQRLADDPDGPYQGLDPNKVPAQPEAPTPSVEELLGGQKPDGSEPPAPEAKPALQ
jgi:hypothetical protein